MLEIKKLCYKEQRKSIREEDNVIYEARCGTVYKGKFGQLDFAFKFYDNLMVPATESSTTNFKSITENDQIAIKNALEETRKLHFESLVTKYDVIIDPVFFDEVVLVSEAPIKSLYYMIHYESPFSENTKLYSKRKLNWIEDILSAVKFLHEKEIVHTDINTSNILLFVNAATGEVSAKLGGLNVVQYLDKLALDKTLKNSLPNKYSKFTIETLAPELLEFDEDKGPLFTKQSDIYALGITINEIMSGRPPYPHFDNYRFFIKEVKRNNYRPKIFVPKNENELEKSLQSIISGPGDCFCLAANMIQRPTIISIIETLLENKNENKVLKAVIESDSYTTPIKMRGAHGSILDLFWCLFLGNYFFVIFSSMLKTKADHNVTKVENHY